MEAVVEADLDDDALCRAAASRSGCQLGGVARARLLDQHVLARLRPRRARRAPADDACVRRPAPRPRLGGPPPRANRPWPAAPGRQRPPAPRPSRISVHGGNQAVDAQQIRALEPDQPATDDRDIHLSPSPSPRSFGTMRRSVYMSLSANSAARAGQRLPRVPYGADQLAGDARRRPPMPGRHRAPHPRREAPPCSFCCSDLLYKSRSRLCRRRPPAISSKSRVLSAPGATAFTSMPASRTSSARVSVKRTTAALDAAYAL